MSNMKTKVEKKEELEQLIHSFFYFKNISDKETVLQEITNLILRSSYLSEGITKLAMHSMTAAQAVVQEYFESMDVHEEESSVNSENDLAMNTFKAHQALLYLHNLIELSEDSNDSKYNDSDEEVFI